MDVKIPKKPQEIKVKMIRVKAEGKEKWELMFPLDSIFSAGGISIKREEILSIINDAVNILGRRIAKNHPSRSKIKEIYQAGKVISDARQKIVADYGTEISNFLDIFAKLLKVDRRNINYLLQLYSSLREEDLDSKIPWTVYRYCISTVEKGRSIEVLNMYKEGKLKSSNEVRFYVKKLNEGAKERIREEH